MKAAFLCAINEWGVFCHFTQGFVVGKLKKKQAPAKEI